MLPVIESFMAAHDLPDVTVVADAGMVPEANQKQIEAAGLSFILGAKIPYVPYLVAQWRREHPGEADPRRARVHPALARRAERRAARDQVIYYQYKADRARRTLRGHRRAGRQGRAGRRREDPGEAQPVSSGCPAAPAPSTGKLEDKAPRPWPAEKATSPTCGPAPTAPPGTAELMIGACHQLFQIATGWSIRKFREDSPPATRTIQIQAGDPRHHPPPTRCPTSYARPIEAINGSR